MTPETEKFIETMKREIEKAQAELSRLHPTSYYYNEVSQKLARYRRQLRNAEAANR